MNVCYPCEIVHAADEIRAVDRFNADGPTGWMFDGVTYPSREDAELARCGSFYCGACGELRQAAAFAGWAFQQPQDDTDVSEYRYCVACA